MKLINKTGKRPPEVEAGLKARMRLVMRMYGGRQAFAKHFGLRFSTVKGIDKFSVEMAQMVHADRSQWKGGVTATFCRPDLKWVRDQLVGSRRVKKGQVYYT